MRLLPGAVLSGKPPAPRLVLFLAIVLPGVGHIMVGKPGRGLIFVLFIVLFALLTLATTTPDQSFVARHAGGLFVWALSVPDAYRRARLLAAVWKVRRGACEISRSAPADRRSATDSG
ncbi:DUF6677 family protein [Aureimonas leprariae]|uniref:DUF6677 family protein n=1 Tax=Plantimonas leprariae TaxID=2615207 RepID=UPI001FEBBD30|nr:DUF6677 family protein [Aureimonas leprariae]